MSETVFYSWQTDHPNRCNRGFIGRALEQAIAGLRRDAELEAAPRLDKDTEGVPGSPDIAATIFEKIDNASAFVADISLVSPEGVRATPNPNVLIELGYAMKALGPDRVVMVANTFFGPLESLPFDLRLKRVLAYSQSPEDDAKESREKLRSRLEAALRLVFDKSVEESESVRLGAYASMVAGELVDFLLLAEQMDDRSLNPWFDAAQASFEAQAARFRDLAISSEAGELEVSKDLRELASLVDAAVAHRRAMGVTNWREYLAKVELAVAKGRAVIERIVEPSSLSQSTHDSASSQIDSSKRKLAGLARHAEDEISAEGWSLWEELRDKSAEIGRSLLYLSYFPLREDVVDREGLRNIGRRLHQLELLEQREMGRQTVNQCLEAIVELASEMEAI